MLKVLFFGTPQVAVPFLEWLTAHATVVGVVCRPDEPVGRGLTVTPPPAKVAAGRTAIPVFQPSGPWTDERVAELAALQADIGIIVAYGRILPRPVFMAPRMGSINLHFSLLPKYRGAAPIQWSLIRGETRTGVTAFWLEEGLDSGPIFHQAETGVDPTDNVSSLREKLVKLGIGVLDRVMTDAAAGRLIRRPQEGTPTLAPQLKKEDGRISWQSPARDIVNLVRGVAEWPGATTTYRPDGGPAKALKIFRASLSPGCSEGKTGAIVGAADGGIIVMAGDGGVRLEEVQPEGKRPMPAWSFWQGARLKMGDKLGEK
jgi:methionyl-tRNA formyltransferase